MPFKSKRQMRWMFANHPDMAKEWAQATPDAKKLPERKTKMSRFSKLSKKIQASGKSKASADAITAAIGRKKYGKKKFQAMAAKGRKKGDAENAKEEHMSNEEHDAMMKKKHKRKYTSTEMMVMDSMRGGKHGKK